MAQKKVLQKVLVAVAALTIIITAFTGGSVPNWSEEFNGPAGTPPDAANWSSVVNGGGGGNQELQYYIAEANALDGKGNLVITASRDTGRFPAWYGASQYTSGKLWTAGKASFRYGHIEVRASLPGTAGQPGAWPAIWMLGSDFPSVGWPQCGEIDIMESFGKLGKPGEVSAAIHTPTDNAAKTYDFPAGTDATAMHVYAVDWRPTSLTFSVDGNSFFTVLRSDVKTWPFDKPSFLIVNLATGGSMGGQIPATAVMPYEMVVDYVRVYNAEVTNR
jgi:beta-glucanase (GH16 family)